MPNNAVRSLRQVCDDHILGEDILLRLDAYYVNLDDLFREDVRRPPAISDCCFTTMPLWESINYGQAAEEVTVIHVCVYGLAVVEVATKQGKDLRYPN